MSNYPLVITILMLSANPKETARLRLDEERREIEAGLERSQLREKFRLVKKEAVRPKDFRRAMLDLKPQIVHFSGHGEGEKGIAFEDEAGKTKLVDAEALAGLFKLFADSVECVILNACYSEVQAEAIARHIPYVIGMSQAIGDQAAIEFSVGFYDALGAGRGIDFAYDFACESIRGAGIAEHLTPVLKKSGSIPTPLLPDSSVPPSSSTSRSLLDKPVVDPPERSEAPSKPAPNNGLLPKKIMIAGLAIASLAGAMVLGGASGIFQKLGSSDEGACFRQAAKEKKLVVAIAQITQANSAPDEKLPFLQNQIYDYLSKQKAANVEICPPILHKITDDSEARKLGQKLNASIVIWGRQSSSDIEVKVTTVANLKVPVRNLTTLPIPLLDSQNSDLVIDISVAVDVMTAYAASEIFRQENNGNPENSQILSETLRLAELSKPDHSKKYIAQVFSQAYYFLGQFYKPDNESCSIHQQMCEKALNAFRQSTEISPRFYQVFAEQSFIEQGLLLESMNQLDKAVKTYSQFIQQVPNSQLVITARGNRASIYLHQGNVKQALTEIKVVCENSDDPFHALWLSVQGRAEILLGKNESAQDTFRRSKLALNGNQYIAERIITDLNQLAQSHPPLRPVVQPIIKSFKEQ
jgi:predicted negative regulator of RcsB-dependent stress response